MYDAPGPVLPEPSVASMVQRQVRRTDAGNPKARLYAMMRIAQMRRQGIDPRSLGIEGDPTAQWRALSPILGAQKNIDAGTPEAYQMPGGMNENVRMRVMAMLAKAQAAQGPMHGVAQPMNPDVEQIGPYVEGREGNVGAVAQRLAGSSNREMLNSIARARKVSAAMRHLRKLRPARRSGLAE